MPKLTMRTNGKYTVSDSFSRYITSCRVRNLSGNTIATYKTRFACFQNFINSPDLPTAEIKASTLDSFTLYLQERNCNDITVQSHIRHMRAFLYFCMENEEMPRFKIKLPKADKRIKETYTDEELALLLKKPNLKKCSFTQYKIWVFSCYLLATGNRISTALDIKISDLDFDNLLIQMNKTKNRKAQIIPLSGSLAPILREYLSYRKGEAGDYLFCNAYGDKADLRTYQDMLARYNKKLGVSKTSAHLYRHTFAKKWILNGGDIFRLQKLLGHSDITVVKEYVNMFSKDLSHGFDKFNPLDNLKVCNNRSKIAI